MSAATKLTEIVTGLGMVGTDAFRGVLPMLPTEMSGVDDASWDTVRNAWDDPALAGRADDAFENGRFFLHAVDALRGRRPRLIEWTGPRHSPGDEVAPIDLRIDHVYLISCKYLSRIVINSSPAHLFDRLLSGGHGRRSSDWFDEVAPVEHRQLWAQSCRHLGMHPAPERPSDLTQPERKRISAMLRSRSWPVELASPYADLCAAVSTRSAERWRESLAAGATGQEAMLWRLLRIGSAPYFVLGTQKNSAPIRLRVSSPWDWRDRFECRRLDITAGSSGQPTVNWRAEIGRRAGGTCEVHGHVEIRWSHGRFGGPPEAKVYLDTPFHEVPGYWELT